MEIPHLVESRREAHLHGVRIEEVGQALLLLCLAISIHHPRGLTEDQFLQVLILLQGTHQRGFITSLLFPEFEGGLGLRVLIDEVLSDAVGIIGGSLRDDVVVDGRAEIGQCLYHQPCRVVGIFHRQFAVRTVCRNQLRQVDGLRARLNLGEGHGDDDTFRSRQQRQIVLFAIAEAFAYCHHLTDERCDVRLGNRQRERGRGGGTSSECERFCPFIDHCVVLGIDESQGGFAADVPLTDIEDTGRDGGLVTLADEARHIGLYHHFLLGYGTAFDCTIIHIFRMGKTHETPSSETLRQRELQGYPTLCIRCQLGIEEGGLVEVLTDLQGRLRCLLIRMDEIQSSNTSLQGLLDTRVHTRDSVLC